jgi:hypothetical protein
MMSTAVRTIVFVLFATACAQGGSSDPSDANNGSGTTDAKPIDGPINPGNDAPIQPTDAAIDSMPVDAMVDAIPPGSNGLCATNANCTNAGECCFNFFGQSPQGFCVLGSPIIPGTETCVPD